MVQGTNAPLLEETLIGPVGTSATAKSRRFTSYQLAPGQNAQNTTASFTADLYSAQIPTIDFYYTEVTNPIAGDLLIRHVDKDNPLNILAVEHIHGGVGSTYLASPKSIPGYAASLDQPQTITFAAQPQTIDFTYEYNTTNPVDINNLSNYLAWVNLEHREKTTNVLLAQSTVLGEFPYQDILDGVTQKQFTVNAAQFSQFAVDGPSTQNITIYPGAATDAIFRYLQRGADNIQDYTIAYLDKNNNRTEVSRETPVQGIPGTALDISTLNLPQDYRLSAENVGQLTFPNDSQTLILVLVEQIPADAPRTDVLLTFKDVRGVPVRGVSTNTITGTRPGTDTEPDADPVSSLPETSVPSSPSIGDASSTPADSSIAAGSSEVSSENSTVSVAEQAMVSQPEAGSMISSDSSVLIAATASGLPDNSSPEQTAEQSETVPVPTKQPVQAEEDLSLESVPESVVSVQQIPQPAEEITLTYNTMLAQRFAGVPYPVQALTPDGYSIMVPASKNILFFEDGIFLNSQYYLPYNITLHPNMVNLYLTLQDEQGKVLGNTMKSVPWNTLIDKNNIRQFFTGHEDSAVIRVQDPNGQASILLNENAYYDIPQDHYPVTVTLKTPSVSNSISPSSNPSTSSKPPSSSRPATSSRPPSSSKPSSSSRAIVSSSTDVVSNNDNGGTDSAVPSSRSMRRITSSISSGASSSGSSSSSSSSSLPLSSSGDSASSTATGAESGAGGTTAVSSGPVSGNGSSGEQQDNTSLINIIGSAMPLSQYFSSPAAAFAFYAIFLILLILAFALLAGSVIKITFIYSDNNEETRKTIRKYFKKIKTDDGLFLNITSKDIASVFSSSTIQVQFGWLYRRQLSHTVLHLQFEQKHAAITLLEKQPKGIVMIDGEQFQ